MNPPPKRTLNAQQVAYDIRKGMDRDALKRKYRLSDKGLNQVFQKLVTMRLLTEADLPGSGGQDRPGEPNRTRGGWLFSGTANRWGLSTARCWCR